MKFFEDVQYRFSKCLSALVIQAYKSCLMIFNFYQYAAVKVNNRKQRYRADSSRHFAFSRILKANTMIVVMFILFGTSTLAVAQSFDHSGVVDNCSSCHNGSDATGKPAIHVQTNADCNFCHTTNTFLPAFLPEMSPITRTDWQMHRGNTWQSVNFIIPSHGHISAYVNAVIPLIDDSDWGPAPNPETIGFQESSQITGTCLESVDYTYFQTFVTVPENVEVTQFNISFSGIDDGGRVSIFNSNYPEGLIVDGSYVYLGGSGTTNLAEYVTSGENRVVVTQVDDCSDENNLHVANVVLNGVIIPSIPNAEAILLQAVTSSNAPNSVVVRTRVRGEPAETIPAIELLSSDSCVAGSLGEDAAVFGELVVGVNTDNVLVENNPSEEDKFDANGDAFLESGIVGNTSLLRYAAVRVKGSTGLTGELSACIVAGSDNDSWVRAAEVVPSSTMSEGYIDSVGNARWYKFAIQPGARATIDVTQLPADYDIAVFKDIGQAFVELIGDEDVDGLNRLGAEFAPSAFSPSAFSPSAFSPSAFSPSAFSPSAFSPSAFSPSAFSPSAFSPSAFSPSAFSPSAFSPSAFSPSAFSPSAFSPSAFSPSAFSPSAFSDDNYSSAQVRSLVSVSAQQGTVSERVIVDTWNNTGYFYVRVNGKNGVYNTDSPYNLSISQEGVECDGVIPIESGVMAAGNGDYSSIILWDSNQLLNSGNSAQDIDALEAKLNELSNRPEVGGVVVDLQSFTQIQDLHAQAEANSACPYAANLTAQAIKQIIVAYREAGNPLKYVVIAGSDGEIPFFRYPDQGLLGPEQNYEPPMADGTQSQSSLRRNYILGQDEYGASTLLSLNDGQFPLPDLAVGRLVETPSEMIIMINAYLSTETGVVNTPNSTLVTGYDFLEDTANAVQNELSLGTNSITQTARNDTLITASNVSPESVCTTDVANSNCSWTSDQLKSELLDEAEDIVFLAGHFSANSALAADYRTSTLVTELASSDVDLTNSLIFSAGCHSGYNIVNADAVPGLTLQLDWTQAFAQKGATLVAGTGYQYGDTDFIEYSERLYVQFAKELRTGSGPVSIGEALVKAKQQYLSTTPDIRGLHRKSILISTLFGLPMLSVDLPGERIVTDEVPTITISGVDNGTPGAQLGLSTASLALTFNDLTEQQVQLTNVDVDSNQPATVAATYFSGPDGVVTNPAEPALPLKSVDVSVAGQSLRGIGFRSSSWSEQQVVPLTGAPATELRGVHTPFASLVNYPMRLATANFYGAISQSGGTILHVTPAQHRVANIGDIEATLRLQDNLDFRLFYSNNTQSYGANRPALAGPPSMSGVQAIIDGQDVIFSVNVVGAPSAGIQSVWVTYAEGDASSGEWVSLDLIQDSVDSTLWTGRLVNGNTDFSRLDYMLQAVNGVGLVSVDDNYGAYYQVLGSGEPVNLLASALTLSALNSVESPYGSTLELEATLLDAENDSIDDATVLFTIGGTTRVARTDVNGKANVLLPLNVTQPGQYVLTASFAGNNILLSASAEQPITVSRVATVLTFETDSQTVRVDQVESAEVSVMLMDAFETPLLERSVYFTITKSDDGSFVTTMPVITDNTGVARLSGLTLAAGDYSVTARFLGDIPTQANTLTVDNPIYIPSAVDQSFEVRKIVTGLTLETGQQTVGVDGVESGVIAILMDEDGVPLDGSTVYFTVASGPDGDITVPAITDANGVANLGTLVLPYQSYIVAVRFLGEIPTVSVPLMLDSPLYDPSSAITTLDLIGGINCPTSNVKGKLAITGFCYLVHHVDGKVSITNGTLIVGGSTEIVDTEGNMIVSDGGIIDQKIDQYGTGSVLIYESAKVRGKITETGSGDIVVSGTVGGQLKESGEGSVEVTQTGVVDGNIDEKSSGSVIVAGIVNGNVVENGEGYIDITSTGTVTGKLRQD